MSKVFFVDTSFSLEEKNPFSKGGQYDENWVILKLTEDKEYQNMTGKDSQNIYTIRLSKCYESWQYRLMDFLLYSKEHNINVILSISEEDYKEAIDSYVGHSNMDKELRSYESKVFVHSTTKELWSKIEKCGVFKSWNIAKRDGDITEKTPIGYLLGDPNEFRDYIMLGGLGYHNEIVVASKQKGRLSYDINEPYTPGARIYLDACKIAKDGLLVRDGLHLKVKDTLSLAPYMLWVATTDNVKNPDEEWTPLNFSKLADSIFLERFKNY